MADKVSEDWRNDDKLLSDFMDHILDRVMNVHVWKIQPPGINREVSYDNIITEMDGIEHPPLEWIEAMRYMYEALPDRFDHIKNQFKLVMSRFILNQQDRLSKIALLEEEKKALALKVSELQAKVDGYEKEKYLGEVKTMFDMLNQKIEALKEPAPVARIEVRKKDDTDELAKKMRGGQ